VDGTYRVVVVARLTVLVVMLLAVAGCATPGWAAPPTFTEGSTAHSMRIGGLDRDYRLYIPAGVESPAPLVVMLHGGFGSAEQAERSYGWRELADRAKFVVAYPDGVGRAWNVNGCCGRPARQNVDDVGFVGAVVRDIATNVPIDPDRVYATGISNGGMMTYALACNTDLFAAIGPDAATQLDPCASPRPTSVVHVHGTADRMIRFDGQAGAGFASIDGPPVEEVNAFWRDVDRCAPPIVTTDGAVSTSTADCAGGRGVTLITVDDGGHDWPPFATEALWQFFASHPRQAR
jgi:polyhydroxybutyrate depolymerase